MLGYPSLPIHAYQSLCLVVLVFPPTPPFPGPSLLCLVPFLTPGRCPSAFLPSPYPFPTSLKNSSSSLLFPALVLQPTHTQKYTPTPVYSSHFQYRFHTSWFCLCHCDKTSDNEQLQWLILAPSSRLQSSTQGLPWQQGPKQLGHHIHNQEQREMNTCMLTAWLGFATQV